MLNYLIYSLLGFNMGNNSPVNQLDLLNEKHIIYSKSIKDSFSLNITFPDNYKSSSQDYPVVYYLDATLHSGKVIQDKVKEWTKKGKLKDVIWVGIGHFSGSFTYNSWRRRDFIQATLQKSDGSWYSNDEWYGQSERFYQFLKSEIIPHIERKVRAKPNDRTLIGHSLGGLFTMYCLFHEENPFQRLIALSPSLWINYENLYKFEEKFHTQHPNLPLTLYLAAGDGETWNYILSGNQKMKKHLETRKYGSLNWTYRELANQSHNSMVAVAIDEVFQKWFSQ